MLPYSMIAGGNFLTPSDSVGVDIELQAQNPPDFFYMRNRSAWGLAAAGTQNVDYWWKRGMAQGTSQGLKQTTATLALTASESNPGSKKAGIDYDGVSTYDTENPPTFTGLVSTTIDKTTYVVLMTDTGSISVGDYVRITKPVGALEIGGEVFQVTAVTPNTSITLGYMATSGMVLDANATSSTVIKFIPGRFYPHYEFIANITKAAQAKVYFTTKNDFTPGEIVSFRVPSEFGMKEINNQQARVLSVVNSATESSIVIDLDTSGFTTFQYPTSLVASDGISPAVCVPSSSGVVPFNGSATIPQQPPGTNLQDSFDNRNTRVIHLGASMFADATAGDIWDWYALKFDQFNQQ